MTPTDHSETPPPSAARPSGPRRLLRPLLAVGALGALALVGRDAADGLTAFASRVDQFGGWAPLVFIVGYALSVAALIPASLLTIAAGALFGLAAGTVYVFIAAVVGSIIGFLIARYAARSWVQRRIARDPRFEAIDRAVSEAGLKITFLLRLSPVFPFSFLNYALGLTRVRLRDYVLASFGMLPMTVVYVYYGKIAGDVAATAAGAAETGTAELAVQAIGLTATLAVAVVVTRLARRALSEVTQQATAAGEDTSR